MSIDHSDEFVCFVCCLTVARPPAIDHVIELHGFTSKMAANLHRLTLRLARSSGTLRRPAVKVRTFSVMTNILRSKDKVTHTGQVRLLL